MLSFSFLLICLNQIFKNSHYKDFLCKKIAVLYFKEQLMLIIQSVSFNIVVVLWTNYI